MLREVWLPFLGVVGLVLLVLVVLLLLRPPARLSLIADFFLTLCVLCPLVLCLFPLCIMLIVSVFLMDKANRSARTPLEALEKFVDSVSQRSQTTLQALNQQVIAASARWAPFAKMIRLFDRKDGEES